MTQNQIPSKPERKPYAGQYLVTSPNRASAPAYYFKPVPRHRPDEWLKVYPAAVRVPLDPAKRTGDQSEYATAFLDAGRLYDELQRMRNGNPAFGVWPKGSLRWLCAEWQKSEWFLEEIAETTRRDYRSCLKQIAAWADATAAEAHGAHPHIRKLTTKGLTAFLSGTNRPRKLLVTLQNLFTFAYAEGVLGTEDGNPCDAVRLTRKRRGEGRKRPVGLWWQAFVDDMAASAVERGRTEAQGAILTMWDIGQRPTDILALRRLSELERQAMKRGTLSHKFLYYDKAIRRVWGWQSKTQQFVSIALEDRTADVLDALAPAEGANQPWMFINRETGTKFTLEQFGHLFKKIATDAGMEDTTFQTGRHSCIMRLDAAGCTDAEITAITGHTDPATVRRKYRTVTNELADNAMKRRQEYEAGR